MWLSSFLLKAFVAVIIAVCFAMLSTFAIIQLYDSAFA